MIPSTACFSSVSAFSLLDALRQPALLLRPDGAVLTANAAFLSAFGLTRSDTDRRCLATLDNGRWAGPGLNRLLASAHRRQADAVDLTQYRDGQLRTFRLHLRPLDAAADDALLLEVEDLTDLTNLRRDGALKNALDVGIDDCVKVLDLEANLLSFNACGLQIMEIDDFEQIRGKNWLDFWGDARPLAQQAVETALAGGVGRFKAMCPTLKGTLKWWSVVVVPVNGPDGRVMQLLSSSRDITELVEKERQLKRREELSRALYEVNPDCVKVLNREGEILSMNANGLEQIEVDDEAAVRGVNWVSLWQNPDRARAAVARALRGETSRFEDYCPSQKGKPMWWDVILMPVRDERGEVAELVSACRNITDRKLFADRLEEQVAQRTQQLQQTVTALQRSNDELAQFAYVASHDLQEPLRKIQVFSGLIQKITAEELSPQIRNLLDRIGGAARRMSTLIQDLLLFSGVSETDQEAVPTDLNRVVSDVLQDFELLIEEKGATVVVGELPLVQAQPILLNQLVNNLVGNALKFSRPETAPHVSITAEPPRPADLAGSATLLPGRTYVRIVVSDNGIGFDPAYGERIFEVFRRLHDRQTYEGTGIGLATCRKIVHHLHGHLWAESRPGEGARFIMLLPTAQ